MPALKALFTAPSGSRRLKGRACAQAERLETRQVLSAANLPVVLNLAAVSEPEPTALGFEVLTFAQTDIASEVDVAGAVDFTSALDVGSAADGKVAWTSSWGSLTQFHSQTNSVTTVRSAISAVPDTVLPAVSIGNLTNISDLNLTTTNVQNSPAAKDSEASVIDDVLQESGAILDSPLQPSVIRESAVSDSHVLSAAVVQQPSENNAIPAIAVPVVQNAALKLSTTVPVFAIPIGPDAAAVSISSASSPMSGWNWQSSSPSEFATRTMQVATVTAGNAITHSASVARSIERLPFASVDDEAEFGWLAGLTGLRWFSTEFDPMTSAISSSTVAAETLPVAVPLVSYNVDHKLSPQNFTITAQTKVKPFREGHRQNSTSTKLVEVAHQHDSLPDLFDSEDVPRALRYVVLPRGPPRKQPDTVLRIMDSDAEAHVLQRLRYSMAPRGPSTVTVEMQSPEKRSFSGPRVSPEESLSVRLVC